ncbi:hypothetical protein BC831DRAFT_157044 [Entophlyctis helioformis]|nr:hypothetical protein BC831DRAFT_157044 [Entophlyctis helioformis]
MIESSLTWLARPALCSSPMGGCSSDMNAMYRTARSEQVHSAVDVDDGLDACGGATLAARSGALRVHTLQPLKPAVLSHELHAMFRSSSSMSMPMSMSMSMSSLRRDTYLVHHAHLGVADKSGSRFGQQLQPLPLSVTQPQGNSSIGDDLHKTFVGLSSSSSSNNNRSGSGLFPSAALSGSAASAAQDAAGAYAGSVPMATSSSSSSSSSSNAHGNTSGLGHAAGNGIGNVTGNGTGNGNPHHSQQASRTAASFSTSLHPVSHASGASGHLAASGGGHIAPAADADGRAEAFGSGAGSGSGIGPAQYDDGTQAATTAQRHTVQTDDLMANSNDDETAEAEATAFHARAGGADAGGGNITTARRSPFSHSGTDAEDSHRSGFHRAHKRMRTLSLHNLDAASASTLAFSSASESPASAPLSSVSVSASASASTSSSMPATTASRSYHHIHHRHLHYEAHPYQSSQHYAPYSYPQQPVHSLHGYGYPASLPSREHHQHPDGHYEQDSPAPSSNASTVASATPSAPASASASASASALAPSAGSVAMHLPAPRLGLAVATTSTTMTSRGWLAAAMHMRHTDADSMLRSTVTTSTSNRGGKGVVRPWTIEEDNALLQAIRDYGMHWSNVSIAIKTRKCIPLCIGSDAAAGDVHCVADSLCGSSSLLFYRQPPPVQGTLAACLVQTQRCCRCPVCPACTSRQRTPPARRKRHQRQPPHGTLASAHGGLWLGLGHIVAVAVA